MRTVHTNWASFLAGVILIAAAPALLAQEFLSQLEQKLLEKQQQAQAEKAAAELNQEPIEFPSVLEPDDLPAPNSTRDGSTSETIPSDASELPAPSKPTPRKAPRSAEKKLESGTKPNSDTKPGLFGLNPFSARTPVNPPTANPSITNPALNQGQPDPIYPTGQAGGGFLGLTVESLAGGGFGLNVVEVAPDSPAWKAGFRNGDRVVGVSGQAVSTVDAFAEQLARYTPGTPVKFLVDRRGRNANLVAVLQDRNVAAQIHGNRPGTALEFNGNPQSVGQSANINARAFFGLNVSDLSDAFRRQFAIPTYRGASVTGVTHNSPAEAAGLKPGDCIVEMDGTSVQSAENVLDTILRCKPGQVISVSYYRGRLLTTASVPLVSENESPNGPHNGQLGSFDPRQVPSEMLSPQYVASLQGELERVNNELAQTQSRLQQLEARLQQIEKKR
jgi:hypothetical protein